MEVKKSLGDKKPISQNEVLRLIDAAVLAGFAGVFCLVASGFSIGILLSAISFVFSLGEFALCGWLLFKVFMLKRILVRSGGWKKLGFREKFDLHEWRKGAL